jgi:hypothetical protein
MPAHGAYRPKENADRIDLPSASRVIPQILPGCQDGAPPTPKVMLKHETTSAP